MKESKAFKTLLMEVREEENKEKSDLMLLAVIAGALKSESLLLDATIDYMLAHKDEDDRVEEYIINSLIDKLIEKKEMMKVLADFVKEKY